MSFIQVACSTERTGYDETEELTENNYQVVKILCNGITVYEGSLAIRASGTHHIRGILRVEGDTCELACDAADSIVSIESMGNALIDLTVRIQGTL